MKKALILLSLLIWTSKVFSAPVYEEESTYANQLASSTLIEDLGGANYQLKDDRCIEDVEISCRREIVNDWGVNNPLMDFTLIPVRFTNWIYLYCDTKFVISEGKKLTIYSKSVMKKRLFSEEEQVQFGIDKVRGLKAQHLTRRIEKFIQNSSCGKIRALSDAAYYEI